VPAGTSILNNQLYINDFPENVIREITQLTAETDEKSPVKFISLGA